jgi:hypothetical protein
MDYASYPYESCHHPMVVRNPSPIPVVATTFLYTLANSKKCVRVRILTLNDPYGIRTRDLHRDRVA